MNDSAAPRLCKATTKSGRPCHLLAEPGSDFCVVHQPVGESAGPEQGKGVRRRVLAELKEAARRVEKVAPVKQEWLDLETYKGLWYMLNYTLKVEADLVKRRHTGEYETDDWGLDQEIVDTLRPLLTLLFKYYWRVEAAGLDQIPIDGRALLAANHSGQLPWDALMLSTAVLTQHPAQRQVRTLYGEWCPTVPFVSGAAVKLGQVPATEEDGIRLLEQGEVVAVFPEGYDGLGKPLRERYRLAPFGRAFAAMALRTGAPIIPVAVVGGEETSLTVHRSELLARLANTPYFPVSAGFPWLGILGLVPLPTKWTIDLGTPIPTEAYGPSAADNPVLVAQVTDQVRNSVQEMLRTRLAGRRSLFSGRANQ